MSANRGPTHEWVRATLAAWAAGVLDPDAATRLEQHLDICEACRAQAATARNPEFSEDDGGEHIPSSLLAIWDRRAPHLDGLLRPLVARHIESCATCRAELVALGHDPTLLTTVTPQAPSAKAPLRPDRSATIPFPRHRAVWSPRHIGAAAFASAASLIVLFVYLKFRPTSHPPIASRDTTSLTPRPRPSPTPEVPRERPGRPAPAPELLALGPGTDGATNLVENVRQGSIAEPPAVAFNPETSEIRFRPPRSLALAAGHRLEIDILDPADRTVRSLRTTLSALFPEGAPRDIVIRRDHEMKPGRYVLRFRVDGTPPDESRYDFELR